MKGYKRYIQYVRNVATSNNPENIVSLSDDSERAHAQVHQIIINFRLSIHYSQRTDLDRGFF